MLTNVQEMAKKFNDVEEVKKELKRIASVKCRLKKQKAKEGYEDEMKKVLEQEQLMKEVRDYFVPKKPTVTTMTEEQIAELNYDETIKAIKSIQSKKCNSQYLTENIEDNVEYQEAVKIEQMLLEHKKTVKPVEDTVVKKSQVMAVIEHLENQEEFIETEYVLQLLQKLVNGEELQTK